MSILDLEAFARTALRRETCEGERRSLKMDWVTPKRAARGGPEQTSELLRRFERLFETG